MNLVSGKNPPSKCAAHVTPSVGPCALQTPGIQGTVCVFKCLSFMTGGIIFFYWTVFLKLSVILKGVFNRDFP